MSNIGLDWGVYQNCHSAWHLALQSASHFEQCLLTGLSALTYASPVSD